MALHDHELINEIHRGLVAAIGATLAAVASLWLWVVRRNQSQDGELAQAKADIVKSMGEMERALDKRISILEHTFIGIRTSIDETEKRRREDRAEMIARMDRSAEKLAKHFEKIYQKLDSVVR